MSTPKQPTAWIRVDLVPTVGDPIRYQVAARPYADSDAWGGLVHAGLVEFGRIRRSLSDRSGSPIVTTFSFETFDRTGFWRDLRDRGVPLTAQDVTAFLASVDAHTTEVDPRVLFRGQLLAPAPRPGRRFSFNAESRVGTRRGPYDLAAPVLKLAYSTDDFEKLPRQFEGLAVPRLWGEESDLGTENAAGEDVSDGDIIPTACGEVFLGSTPGNPPRLPTLALPPTNLAVTFNNSGGTRVHATIGVSFIVEGGGETTVTALEVPNYLQSPDVFFGGTHEAYWTWDDPNAAGVIRRARLWFSEGYVDVPQHNIDTNVSRTSASASTSYTDDGDDSHTKNLYGPPPLVNTAQIAPGAPGTAAHSFFYEWLTLLNQESAEIISIAASNLAAGSPAKYQKIAASDIGDDFSSGKPFLLGPDGTGIVRVINGHSYFGFYVKKGDGRLAAHLDGSMPFRVNACGWHDIDGKVIDQAARVYLDVIVQQSGPDGGKSGARQTGIPTFASSPSVPIAQSTTFEAVQAVTARFLDTVDGYKARVYLDSFDTTWRDFETKMNAGFRFDCGENHHGQKMLAIADDEQDPEAGPLLQEQIDIVRVENAGELEDGEVYTVVRYQFDRCPISKAFRSGVLEVRADEAIVDLYGERVLDLEFEYTRDPATARDVALRWLVDASSGPTYPAVVTRLRKGVALELGSPYRIRHADLLTLTARPMYLRSQDVDVTRGEVLLTGRDRTGMFAAQAAPDVTTGTTWSDATAAERLLYGFATDDDGRLPDGSFGTRAR